MKYAQPNKKIDGNFEIHTDIASKLVANMHIWRMKIELPQSKSRFTIKLSGKVGANPLV